MYVPCAKEAQKLESNQSFGADTRSSVPMEMNGPGSGDFGDDLKTLTHSAVGAVFAMLHAQEGGFLLGLAADVPAGSQPTFDVACGSSYDENLAVSTPCTTTSEALDRTVRSGSGPAVVFRQQKASSTVNSQFDDSLSLFGRGGGGAVQRSSRVSLTSRPLAFPGSWESSERSLCPLKFTVLRRRGCGRDSVVPSGLDSSLFLLLESWEGWRARLPEAA
ncbi:hypothetical protein CPLU01_10357 [Colletotrichum plurivorum]|uniref:Uncharacterized protein n=1 Tax=Colletotrichum plurivorum TaxID=2175906 RepID=A0A8H6K5X1_9PEZI|nr:hypothetical protein CPLU01_10357 [Colletotrichum plurivorum]